MYVRGRRRTGEGVHSGIVGLLGPHNGAYVRQPVGVDALRLRVLAWRRHPLLQMTSQVRYC